MAALIDEPSIVQAAGSPPKTIREHVGRVNTSTATVSIAHMSSPPGWAEPWQTPAVRRVDAGPVRIGPRRTR
jgi:hypothetical protein